MLKIKRKPQNEVIEQLEETKEEGKMKSWTLKKKIIVGLGVLGTAALGALAYGQLKPEEEVHYNDSNEDDESDVYDDEELENDLKELEELEKAEEAQE